VTARLRQPSSSPCVLDRPLRLEGEAGVGKTELTKVLARVLGTRLIRLQCYEGLDVSTAVYEWNYPRQMLETA
jgi:MoxR-like ATPase